MLTRVAPVLFSTMLLVAGCSPYNSRKLEGHVFAVPKLNDTSDETLFFLPAPDLQDGFSFILDPNVSLPERNRILIGSKVRDCARAIGTNADVNKTICTTRPISWRGAPLRKFGDEVFWSYQLLTDAGEKTNAVIARCSQMGTHEDPKPGICRATLPYGDLTVSIGFRDNQATKIQSLYDQVIADLRKWERGANGS